MAESRADFDPKQAPKGWDYEKQGKPDILFWRYAGEEAAQAAKPTDVESLWKSNYEVAEEWRDTEIRKAEEENANKTVEEEKQPTNEHMVDKKPKSDIIKEEKDYNDSVQQYYDTESEISDTKKHGYKIGKIDDLPKTVKDSYYSYEKVGWKGNYNGQTLGTKAGAIYKNLTGYLPKTDANGRPITYREFDVNNRKPGVKRDSERFVVGSDGSVYYTDSHYGENDSPGGLPPFIKIK